MRLKHILVLAIVQLALVMGVKGQSLTAQKELEMVRKFFSFNPVPAVDSSGIYAFSFLVEVKQDSKGKFKVESLTATDSIAFTLYPKSDFFRTLNYALFMEGRKFAILFFRSSWKFMFDQKAQAVLSKWSQTCFQKPHQAIFLSLFTSRPMY